LGVSTQLKTGVTLQPKSQTMFHFTKDLKFLKDILLNGFWPRYCLEDMEWWNKKESYTAYPIVCFCDIPLSRIEEHVNFYGRFGIGVKRDWAISNGLSPILYLNDNSQVYSSFRNFFTHSMKNTKLYSNSVNDHNLFMSHIKPIEGWMDSNGKKVKKEFYQENEWRATIDQTDTTVKPFLYQKDYNNQNLLNSENEKTKKKYSLKVKPQDISYIFVESDSDIPELVNFIQMEMDEFTGKEVKILLTRIVSMETIKRDL
jgi:hypothetical protein